MQKLVQFTIEKMYSKHYLIDLQTVN